MTVTYTFAVCKLCGKNHGRVVRQEWIGQSKRCDCQMFKIAAGIETSSSMAFCSTSAEARRVSKTILLKSTLAEAVTPTFYDVMVKRLSKKRADQIEQAVRGFLKVRGGYPGNPGDIWNPDYCNAFGIMQGVAYALGFDGSNPAPGHPRHWFDKLVKEYPLRQRMK